MIVPIEYGELTIVQQQLEEDLSQEITTPDSGRIYIV
jgi:hypothetical protein